ncbi:hypothetical protein M5D96_001761 [Drosophila gunungcola]|uniref:Uncharacterized protein n=1 Tax=Drosophila gunungcola TaxID=103775 RepID=A0A9P9YYS8_9MUSC|nr:hypothetical protein M5D96_001761 [Drosophila gunungcola]
MSFLLKGRRFLIAGILPAFERGPDDIVDKENKTYKAFLASKPPEETGLERLKQMFSIDEFGSISSELNSIYQAGFLGFLIGAIYGGVTQSRVGYMNFMENNQATAFKSHFDAKKKLQDQFTVNFAKGGFKWGWRVGLFTTSYFGIITCMSVYRGKSSIYEYLAAGSVTGSLYKMNLGLRGMAAGGIIGGFLGGVRYWQYKWRLDRDDNIQQAFKKLTEDEQPELFKVHDEKVPEQVSLDSVKPIASTPMLTEAPMASENIMDELASLIRTEIPDGRQSLRDSYTNLERVADYCEDTYYRADNKKAALEATKNYTTHVAYQINTLAYSYMQLLELQAQQLGEMESQMNHIAQTVHIHKEKVARREIGVLTANKVSSRQFKIVAPINPEKPIKYVRQKHRGSSHGSVQSLLPPSVGPPPTTKPPTPPQMSRAGNTGTLGKSVSNTGTLGKSSREYRTPPVVNPPQRMSTASSTMTTTTTGGGAAGNERAAGYSALPMPPSQQIATHVNLPSAGMMQSLPPPPPTTYDDRSSMPPAPPSPLTVSQHEMTEQSHIGMHTLGRNINSLNFARPGSQSPPLPPPPPPEDEHQDFGRPRTSTGPQLAPIVPEDQNLPGWVPKNFIEKVVAIYDYYADKDDELSFQESSVLYVLKKNDDGWWEGVMDGVTGLFPGNYVEPCQVISQARRHVASQGPRPTHAHSHISRRIEAMSATAGASSWSGSSGGSNSSQGRSIATAQPAQEERLVVAVRVRPSLDGTERCIEVVSGGSLLYDDGGKSRPRQYSYDHHDSQEQVYKTTTAPLVRDVLNGLNAAVFAYGATGSGKTHTMLGPVPRKKPQTADRATATAPYDSTDDIGLMVRAIEDIFSHIESAEADSCRVSISYLEIYNELIRDLLNPGGPLELREDHRGQRITVAGLSEITTSSRKEVGNKARTMEPTAANQTSSRSHALLSIMVQARTPLGTKQGRLFLTDLAGSERAKKTKNRGKRLQEGAHINRSLLALGNALSGRCKTVMIAHVAPEGKHRDETKNTLVYADRANSITTKLQNSVYIDEFKDFPTKHYQSLVSELRDEVSRLRTKMLTERPRIAPGTGAGPEVVQEHDEQRKTELRYLREQIVLTFKQQMKLRRKLLEAESHLLGLELDAERQHMIISHWQGRIGKLYDAMGEDDIESEGSVALKNAWGELAAIEKETRRYKEIRERTEHELEQCRQKGVKLEDELPERISSDEERELLALLCRVHELEADKAERLARQAELRRRDLQLLRAERQRRLCEDIISSQRRLIEEGNVDLPDELRELYGLYQQEIHAGVVTPSTSNYERKLPPIYTAGSDSPGSSSSSEWSPASPLPQIDNQMDPVDRVMGPPVNPRLPRLSTASNGNISVGGPRRPSLRVARNSHPHPHPHP